MFSSVFSATTSARFARKLRKRGNNDVFWGNLELAAFAITLLTMFVFNWRYVIFYFLPFWYLGHCFSYLNGITVIIGANPDKPIAWVSAAMEKSITGFSFIRIPRRTPFPPESALDENGKVPPKHR